MQRKHLPRLIRSRLFSLGITAFVVAALLVTACSSPAAPAAPTAAPAAPAAAGQPTAAAPAAAQPAGAKQEIKMGMTWSLTGGTADFGESAKDAAELALQEYNASPTGKYKITPVYYDDETKPEKGVQNTLRLINQDKVASIVGPVNSGVGLAMIDVVKENKILQISNVATTPVITQKYKDDPVQYTFRTSIPDDQQIQLMLDWVAKKGYTKIGFMHDTTGWGNGGKDASMAEMKARNISPTVGPLTFAVGDLDMTPQLQQMKAGNVDVIIAFALGPEGAQILKSMDKMNWKVPMISTWAWSGISFQKLTGNNALLKNTCTVLSFTPNMNEKTKAFDAKIVKQFGSNPVAVASGQTYDAVRLEIRALEAGGVGNADKQVQALENLSDFDPITTMAAKPFSKGNHEALGRANGYVACYDENAQLQREP